MNSFFGNDRKTENPVKGSGNWYYQDNLQTGLPFRRFAPDWIGGSSPFLDWRPSFRHPSKAIVVHPIWCCRFCQVAAGLEHLGCLHPVVKVTRMSNLGSLPIRSIRISCKAAD